MDTRTKKQTHRIDIRLTEYERNKIQISADKYAGGNLSLWLRHAALNAPRRPLKKQPATRE